MDGSGALTGLATILSSNVGSATKVPLALNNTTTLQQFSDNAVVRGTVVAKGAHQSVTIKTAQGNITIQTEVPLKRGAEVAFRVEQHGNNAVARLISVNGLSLGKYLEQVQGQLQQSERDIVNTSSKLLQNNDVTNTKNTAQYINDSRQSPSLPITRGVFVILPSAVALSTSPLTPPMNQLLTQAHIGTSVQLHILDIQVPNAGGTGLQPLTSNAHTHNLSTAAPSAGYALTTAQKVNATLPQTQVEHANIQAAKSTLSPAPPAGTTTSAPTPAIPPSFVTVTQDATTHHASQTFDNNNAQNAPQSASVSVASVPNSSAHTSATENIEANLNIKTPGTNPSAASSAQTQLPSNTLQGVVIHNSQPRELTVQTDIGTFKLFVTTSLPKNSVITFELINIADVRHTQQPHIPTSSSADLSSFKELDALTHAIPFEAAARHQPQLVPRTGAALTTEIVFLMTALKGGDFRKWIGDDNITQLELQGKANMLGQLATDFKALGTIPADPRDNHWHQLLIPLAHEQQIHPVKLFTKGQEHESPNGTQNTTNHFLVDLELTKLGRLQIDGLVQQRGTITQFDAVIRTDKQWDTHIQQDIRAIYERAQAISGFSGSVRFDTTILPLPIDNDPQPPSNGRSIIA